MAGRFRGFLEKYLGSHRFEATKEHAPDTELLRRFSLTGDQQAFELLVWRHGEMVLGVCQRQTCDLHLAEDAFQAVFLVLARKASSVRSENLAGWLYRVARRVATKATHCRSQSQALPEMPIEQEVSHIEQFELFKLLDLEIARLPERLRRPILLCYLGGRSTEEAARVLGCPRGTILSRLSTARKRLADCLGRKGITLPAALPVFGLELNGRIVSATTIVALKFVAGPASVEPVSLLAQGVIRTMKISKQLTFLGIALMATGAIGGMGWVTAKSNSGETRTDSSAIQDNLQIQFQKTEPDGIGKNTAKGGFVRAEQQIPQPEEWEGIVEILKLDPVIGDAFKPNSKDSQLRKLQKEICFALGTYMAKVEVLIQIGKWNPQDFSETIRVSVSLPKNLIELMEKPEDKLKCYELEVKLLKGIFDFTNTRVMVGTDPSQNRDVAKAAWLESEVKLLKLKLEIEKAKK